jgi:hypothetical protein
VIVGSERPLWACKACGRTFANPKQTHTCAALGSVDVQNAEFAAQLAEAYPSARRSTGAATLRAARPTDDRRFRVPVAVDRRLRASTVDPTAAEARERRSLRLVRGVTG